MTNASRDNASPSSISPLRSILLSGISIVSVMLAAPTAWAQCADNFNVAGVGPGTLTPASRVFPLGSGTSVASFVSTINTMNTAFLATNSAFVSAPAVQGTDQQGGGGWSRVVGGSTETKTNSSATLSGLPGATGQQTCNSVTKQDYVGYQFGQDLSVLNVSGSGANIHFGATAGYFEAKTKDVTPAGSFINPTFGLLSAPAGSFQETSRIPFVGLYGTFTQGQLFADVMARFDAYENILNDGSNGLLSQASNARGYSLTGNVGYNIPIGTSGWFVEPSGGLVVSSVKVDALNVAGITAGGFQISRGSVVVDDIESRLARGSVTLGTSFTTGSIGWQPYATASIYHEFADNVGATSTLYQGSTSTGIALTSSIGRVGTYAQLGLGTAAVFGDSGWLGYVRADYKTGDRIEGISGTAGLRYQFGPQPTRKLSIKDSAPSTDDTTVNWTGAYAGAMFGANIGRQDWAYQSNGAIVDPAFRGWLAGGQLGYNYQIGALVLGIEGEIAGPGASGGKACPNPNFFTCQASIDNMSMLTGRLGLAWRQALFYAKAGAVWADTTVGTQFNLTGNIPPSGGRLNETTVSSSGWALGGGMEFAFTEAWSAKAEYMHFDLGNESYAVDNGLIVKAKTAGDSVRIGVNYHFR